MSSLLFHSEEMKSVLCFVYIFVVFCNKPIKCWYQQRQIVSNFVQNTFYSDADKIEQPLSLSEFIEKDKITEAIRASEVINLPHLQERFQSYSGYFTVNKTYNSNMFFWFIPPLSGKTENVPILLWLEGGPGDSSMMGLFAENGPIQVDEAGRPSLRDTTWNREFAVLYLDNPVGTGFSFTENDKGYARNENEVARDLYLVLVQFFTVFADYRNCPFFLTGYSYAGKYLPAIGYKIHSMGDQAKEAGINLQGIAIGNVWCDPPTQYNYGDFLYQLGLINQKEHEHFLAEQTKYLELLKRSQYLEANNLINQLMFLDNSYFQNVTGLVSYENILHNDVPQEREYYRKYLELSNTRTAIHVGNRSFNPRALVENALLSDVMQSVKPWVESLLNANYSTLFYSGNLDIVIPSAFTEKFLQSLKWKGSRKFTNAQTRAYKVNSQIVGHVRQAENLHFVTLRKAGHVVPYDQPVQMLNLITQFVNGVKF